MAKRKQKPKEKKYVTLKDIVIPAGTVLKDAGEVTHYDHYDHMISLCDGDEVAYLMVPKEAFECQSDLFTELNE